MGKDKGRKDKDEVPVSGGEQLTHSPFAGLAKRSAPAQQLTAAEPEQPAPAQQPKLRGRLVLRRETKRRGGKAVVIIGGFNALQGFDAGAVAELAKACKHTLGCGGTVEQGEIILQGDQPARVAEWLRAQGFRVEGVTS